MDFSIRMIGVASTVFWILLLAFFASAVYSVKDLHLSLGEPQLTLTANSSITISIPINIENGGYYSLGDFNLTTKVADLNGTKITEGSIFIPTIKRGCELIALHNLTFSIDMLLEKGVYYLFNDSSFTVTALVSVKLAEVIPVKALSNFSVPWGAPFYNFQLGQPTCKPVNQTHVEVVVPISFENHAPVEINGEITIFMCNDEGTLAGQGASTITAPQGTLYIGEFVLYVQISEIGQKGFFEVYFSTQFLSYGPLVIPYG